MCVRIVLLLVCLGWLAAGAVGKECTGNHTYAVYTGTSEATCLGSKESRAYYLAPACDASNPCNQDNGTVPASCCVGTEIETCTNCGIPTKAPTGQVRMLFFSDSDCSTLRTGATSLQAVLQAPCTTAMCPCFNGLYFKYYDKNASLALTTCDGQPASQTLKAKTCTKLSGDVAMALFNDAADAWIVASPPTPKPDSGLGNGAIAGIIIGIAAAILAILGLIYYIKFNKKSEYEQF